MKQDITAELLPYVKLLFEVDNPSLEECYQWGYQMAQDGLEESENPFMETNADSKEAEYWNQGWWDGCYGVEPMFEVEPVATAHAETTMAEAPSLTELSANEDQFEVNKESKMTTVAKLAAAVAGAFLSYQVIDMIA